MDVWCDNCGCDDPELVTKNSCDLVRCENCCWEEEDIAEEEWDEEE